MNSIFKGDLSTAKGRVVAWIDSLFIDHAVFRLAGATWSPLSPARSIAVTIPPRPACAG